MMFRLVNFAVLIPSMNLKHFLFERYLGQHEELFCKEPAFRGLVVVVTHQSYGQSESQKWRTCSNFNDFV